MWLLIRKLIEKNWVGSGKPICFGFNNHCWCNLWFFSHKPGEDYQECRTVWQITVTAFNNGREEPITWKRWYVCSLSIPINYRFGKHWIWGAGWLSVRIEGSQVRASLETLPCVLEQDTLSCSTQEDQSLHYWKIVDWDIKNQHEQTVKTQMNYRIWG